jgi:hypothetical protein
MYLYHGYELWLVTYSERGRKKTRVRCPLTIRLQGGGSVFARIVYVTGNIEYTCNVHFARAI